MNQLTAILQNLQHTPSLLMIIGTIATLSVATAVSGSRSSLIRMMFYFGLAAVMFYLSNTLTAENSEFFLNVGVELLGAVLTFIILGDWVTSQAWLFPVIFILTVLSTLTVELSPAPLKSFFLNMTAQLVGSLLILILVKKRNWFWGRGSRRSRRLEAAQSQMSARKELRIEQWKASERQKLQQEIEQEMKAWKAKSENWNTAIKIGGTDKRDMQDKLRQLRKVLTNAEILKVDEGDGVVQCYVVGTLNPNA